MTSKPVTTKAFGVELTATFHTDKDRVSVDISITNVSDKVLYISDFSTDVTTGKEFESSLVVEYEPLATAILTRRVFPLPPNTNFGRPPTVSLNRIGPGKTHKNTLQANAPLRVQGAQQKEPDVECLVVRLEIGVIAELPDIRPKASTYQGKTWYELGVAVAYASQKIVKVETSELKVPLVTR
jgi:hypothetical protein